MDVLQELSQSLLNLNSGHSLPVVLQRIVAQKTRELQALAEINRSIACSLDRKVLLNRIAAQAKSVLELDGVVIRLVEGNKLVRAAHAGSGELSRLSTEIDRGKGLSGTAVHEKRVVAIKNILHETRLTAEYRELLAKRGCRSVLCVPLRAGDSVVGAIVGAAKKEREFQPDEIDMMTALADQAAIAFQNCTLFEAAKTKSDELRRISKEFEQVHRAKAKFISAVSHELRTPLQVIIGYVDLLKDGIVGQSREEQRRVLTSVLQNAEMLDRLIGNVLALTKAEAKETALDISTAQIEEIMDDIRGYADRIHQNERVKFSWTTESDLPPITTDVTKLAEILQNLVGNACKFTLEGRIEVRAANLRSKSRCEFSVADSGIGIEESDREKIFDEFYQARQARSTNRAGIGLGLSIVKKYLSLMQGDIRVESQLGKGTSFTFTLPYSIP